MSDEITAWLGRIDQVSARLRALTEISVDGSGEKWGTGEIWGHLGELVDFWIEQIGDVIDEYQGEPVHFGRALDDSTRTDGLVHGVSTPVSQLVEEVLAALGRLGMFLGALPEGWRSAHGVNRAGDIMPAAQMIERLLVGHLEEHVAQLEALR
jgi:hypothetical protein